MTKAQGRRDQMPNAPVWLTFEQEVADRFAFQLKRTAQLQHVVNQLMDRIQELESSKGIVKPFDLELK